MKRISRFLVPFVFCLLWLVPAVFCQGLPMVAPKEVGLSPKRLARIDHVMQEHVSAKKIAGTVALIARRGQVGYLRSFGMMDIEANKPMQSDTIFRIASMTKPITSVAVMMLYEQGHFFLNDPVSKYIPQFKQMQVLPPESADSDALSVPAEREITVHHLLTHMSGLTYQWNLRLGETYKNAGVTHGLVQDESTIGEKMKTLAGLPLLHQPGEKFEYGLSIDVLGYLVEVVSGMTLDEFFQQRIFKPLGMKDTHFFLPDEKVSRLAAVYHREKDSPLERHDDVPINEGSLVYSVSYPYKGPRSYFSGGGGLVSTISDYARFCQMMLNGGELDGIRLLSRKTVELMTTNRLGDLADFGFGLGFSVVRDESDLAEIGSVGTYGWGGFFYTTFFIDTQEEMIGIFMGQLHPTGGLRLGDKFKILAYQAIVD